MGHVRVWCVKPGLEAIREQAGRHMKATPIHFRKAK